MILNPSTVLDAVHTKMSKCEQLFSAVNYSEVLASAAATKASKFEATPGVRRQLKESLKSKSMKIINHLVAFLQFLTWSFSLEIPEIRNLEPGDSESGQTSCCFDCFP